MISVDEIFRAKFSNDLFQKEILSFRRKFFDDLFIFLVISTFHSEISAVLHCLYFVSVRPSSHLKLLVISTLFLTVLSVLCMVKCAVYIHFPQCMYGVSQILGNVTMGRPSALNFGGPSPSPPKSPPMRLCHTCNHIFDKLIKKTNYYKSAIIRFIMSSV